MSQALTFQSTTFDVIDHNGQPWIQSRQLAAALGYKDESSVRRIYERNSDEFTDGMTATVNLTVGITPVDVRVFSLRGCYAVAMFARTQIAKSFRVWVLDVLESLNAQPAPQPQLDTSSRLSKSSDPERKELTAMINAWVSCAPIHYAGARSVVNAHFGVKSVDELTVEQVKEAILFVQGKIAEPQQLALPTPDDDARLDAALDAVRYAANQLKERSMDLYRIADQRTRASRNLRHGNPNRSLCIQTHQGMEKMVYSLGYLIDSMEWTARMTAQAAGM